MSIAIYSFIEYTVGVGAVVYAPPYKTSLGSEKMKSDKELFGLAQMYVGLEREYTKASEYDLYELGEIKRYRRPKDLSEYGCNFAPQSYIYVTE